MMDSDQTPTGLDSDQTPTKPYIQQNKTVARRGLSSYRLASFTARAISELRPDSVVRIWKHPTVAGLAVKVRPNGRKVFVFDRSALARKVQLTLGPAPESVNDGKALTVPEAEKCAAHYNAEIAAGRHPKAMKLERSRADDAALAAEREGKARLRVTVGDAWSAYVAERSREIVRRDGKALPAWSEEQKRDVAKLARLGGEPRKRGKGQTTPGPLASLMREPLATLDGERVEQWARGEVTKRATQAALAYRHLVTFLRWCSKTKPYRDLLHPEALALEKVRAVLGSGTRAREDDCLEPEELSAWFNAVLAYPNPVMRAYLAVTFLLGARRGETASLRWSGIDFHRKRITMKDKRAGTRIVPLSPYVEHLLRALARRGDFVFHSVSASGHIEAPTRALAEVCAVAGTSVTVHGLRRSFDTLAEVAGLPDGVIGRVKGHVARGVRERHYKRRSITQLGEHLAQWERWVLEKAGIEFQPVADGLRLVKG